MAPARKEEQTSVTRTYRAAIRLGEDFVTLEETITLPVGASDEEVQRAVDLGWRIYQAQREALEQQAASIRESQAAPQPIVVRDPDAPASEKQRNYIGALQEDLAWTNDQLAAFAGDHGVDLLTMTKGQASGFIDELKRVAEDRPRYEAGGRSRAAGEGGPQPASERQIQALGRLAQSRGLDLAAEVERRFGVAPAQLNDEQARGLLGEWQPRPARAASGAR